MASKHNIPQSGSRQDLSVKPRYSVSRAKIQPPNRYALGENLAVLFCPAKRGLMFGVPIDRADLPHVLSAGLWRVANTYPGGKRFRLYAYTFIRENGERKRVYLHRFVTSAPAGTEVDHGNHRGTDNRRSANLAVVTHQKNMMNQRRFRQEIISNSSLAAPGFSLGGPAIRGQEKAGEPNGLSPFNEFSGGAA